MSKPPKTKKMPPTGGFAFPVAIPANPPHHGFYAADGMTIRTYLAGQALAGLAADPNWMGSDEDAATLCTQWADALIARLGIGKEGA